MHIRRNIPPENPMWEYMTVNHFTMKLLKELAEAGVESERWKSERASVPPETWRHRLWIGKNEGLFPLDAE